MKPSTFENELNRLTGNVWLISESEHSFTYQHLGKLLPPALPATLAGRHQAADAQVRTLTPEAFISKIEKAAAHADSVIVANTQKIKNLVQYLQQHLTQVAVYRIETGVSVPVYILGFLADGSCVGVSSFSIET